MAEHTDLKRGLREARQNLKNGKVREALARLFHLTEKYPEDREVKGEIAYALLAQGRDHAERGKTEQAREDFKRSIRYSETPEGHLYLGQIFQENGDYDDAFAEYTRALDLDEGMPAVHENLGVYFLEIQDFEQAAKAFSNAIVIGAAGREPYIGLWRANVGLERLDRAHEAILDGTKKFPKDDVLMTVAGVSCVMRKETAAAADWWTKASAANPKNVEPIFHLGGLAARRGDRDEALRAIRRCMTVDADRARALWRADANSPDSRYTAYHEDEDFIDVFG
jgi:tetratricopeptide (TPR) repeat protein